MTGRATAAIPATARATLFAGDAPRQDRPDSFFQIRPGDAGNAAQGRFQANLANVKDPFRVDLWFITQTQHGLVAGSLAFVH
jgi:hypothetical protein